ncbi:MAG: DNA primase [Cytophagales bacterium]
MRITKECIDQIYAAFDVVEVVGDFVNLKKSGANYKGLSPFTSEKSPSFFVSPAKQIFKCFSTGIGGDAVKFLMEVDKLTYVEALKYLAKKYNIELQYDQQLTDEQTQEQSERDALFIVLEYAKNYYQNILLKHADGEAIGLSYFKERGLNEKTIKDFELGFALDGWDNLILDAKKNQYSVEILEKAGLVKTSEKNTKFDFFRNRVMFPIQNSSGKVVALAGRILGNDKGTAKYINSPETELYHKSYVLYGLHQAKNTIRSEDNCLLVEGYMDVISLYQAGITNVVASSGTSLTQEQVKLISRYTKNITVLYDGDNAGIKAALRGTDLILDSGLNIKVLLFPDGHDPDSFVQEVGHTAFREYMKQNAKDFITFKAETLLKESANDPLKKAEVIREVVNSIAKVQDNIQRALYFTRCSQLLAIDEQVIISEYNKIQLANRKKQEIEAKNSQTKSNPNPDEFPSEDIASAYNLENEYSPVQTQISEFQGDEVVEQEIVRILIEYADFPIDEQTRLYTNLFQYVQNIEFKNPKVARIFAIFQEELMNGNVIGLDYFLANPENEIEKYLINLLSDKHELSEVWENKLSIYIPAKDADKMLLLNKILARMNFEKLNYEYKKVSKVLQNTSLDLNEENEVYEKQIAIKSYLKLYAKEIGDMVVNG